MKINCPLSDISEVLPLLQSGADSFYAGISSQIMFGYRGGIPNRRPWKCANFSSLEAFKKACYIIHYHDKKITFTINEHFYDKSQLSNIVLFINKIIPFIDGIVVADLGLMIDLKKKFPHLNIIASTGAHIQNKKAIEFYKKIGIKKIVIPRHFTVTEIGDMVKPFGDIAFECFVLDGDCANIDGLCHFVHGIYDRNELKVACASLKNFSVKFRKDVDLDPKKDFHSETCKHLKRFNELMFNRCGVCALWDFHRMNISSIKICGREAPLKRKIMNTIFVKTAFSFFDMPKNKYRDETKKLRQNIWGEHCGSRCYYKA